MNSPTISIIVPCYNQAQYLDECLQSVLDQTYQDWECIIVNDGSPDNTSEIAKTWLEKDSRFKYIFQGNKGVSAARNNGIKNARGGWILPLDGDDKIEKDYLLFASKKFNENPHIIYCRAEYFGSRSDEMVLNDCANNDILLENNIFCTALYKKSSWKKIGGYDENMIQGYEDWEFWIHLSKHYGSLNIIKLNHIGFYYRIKVLSRNTEAKKRYDNDIKQYIFRKHAEMYCQNISGFYKYFVDSRNLKKENGNLREKLNSKRYKAIDQFLNFFNK